MALGAAIDFRGRFGQMRRHYTSEPGKITVHTLVQLPSRAVPVEDIAAFNGFLSTIVENSSIRLRAELGG